MTKAVFFDRDGVLNELVQRDRGFYSPRSFDQFIIDDSANFVISKLRKKGFLSIVVSNQPDIARGNIKKSVLDKMTEVLINKLMVDDVFYCTHDDSDLCNCRKPAPGLFIQAAEKWEIDLKKSYMIGDTWKDTEAANNANVNSLLLVKDSDINFNSQIQINNLEDIFNYIK